VPVALALMGVWWRRRSRVTWVYVALAIITVELSFGLHGTVYGWLQNSLWAMRGFRAPARFAILACCALAVLAGFGFQHLQERVSRGRIRAALLVTALVALGVEFGSAPMRLDEVSTRLPDIYRFLQTVDRSVVVEFPIEDWSLSPVFMFWSIWHWHPLVNGYSGFAPPDYAETLVCMRDFPEGESIERLRELNVRYLLVHEWYYKQSDFTDIMLRLLRRPDVTPIGHFRDWVGDTEILELKSGAEASDAKRGGAEQQRWGWSPQADKS
jgi:hypothetical protein